MAPTKDASPFSSSMSPNPSDNNLTVLAKEFHSSDGAKPSDVYSLSGSNVSLIVELIHRNASTGQTSATSTAASAPPVTEQTGPSDTSAITKITVLLIATAVVLIVSYRFVVRLFLGYADRKDEMIPDGFSDDEDSAVVKRDPEPERSFMI